MRHDFGARTSVLLAGAGAGALLAGAAGWWTGRGRALRDASLLHRALVDLLLNTLSAGDESTAAHSRRVADLTYALAAGFRFDREACATLRLAALLHDMGKIDDRFFDVLHSRERLSDAQRQKIKAHPHESAHILEPLEAVHPGIMRIVSSHHECWNGTGYPDGLAGEEIPLAARIISVADVFDATTQWRTYREPMPIEKAFALIRDGAGNKFDPDVVRRVDLPAVRDAWVAIVRAGREAARERIGP